MQSLLIILLILATSVYGRKVENQWQRSFYMEEYVFEGKLKWCNKYSHFCEFDNVDISGWEKSHCNDNPLTWKTKNIAVHVVFKNDGEYVKMEPYGVIRVHLHFNPERGLRRNIRVDYEVMCICRAGFFGDNCRNMMCIHGVQERKSFFFNYKLINSCKCYEGYKGEFCAVKCLSPKCDDPCDVQTLCDKDLCVKTSNTTFMCKKTCLPCENGGTCNEQTGLCMCKPNYFGDSCEKKVECNSCDAQKMCNGSVCSSCSASHYLSFNKNCRENPCYQQDKNCRECSFDVVTHAVSCKSFCENSCDYSKVCHDNECTCDKPFLKIDDSKCIENTCRCKTCTLINKETFLCKQQVKSECTCELNTLCHCKTPTIQVDQKIVDNPCFFETCNGNGNCTLLNKDHFCMCKDNFEGLKCEHSSICPSSYCNHNGVCHHNYYTKKMSCTCTSGFGDNCKNPCVPNPCRSNQFCRVVKDPWGQNFRCDSIQETSDESTTLNLSMIFSIFVLVIALVYVFILVAYYFHAKRVNSKEEETSLIKKNI